MNFIHTLSIGDFNPGACLGPGCWRGKDPAQRIASINPATGERIASIGVATASDLECLIGEAQQVFAAWPNGAGTGTGRNGGAPR